MSRIKPGTSPAASGKIYPSMDAAVEVRCGCGVVCDGWRHGREAGSILVALLMMMMRRRRRMTHASIHPHIYYVHLSTHPSNRRFDRLLTMSHHPSTRIPPSRRVVRRGCRRWPSGRAARRSRRPLPASSCVSLSLPVCPPVCAHPVTHSLPVLTPAHPSLPSACMHACMCAVPAWSGPRGRPLPPRHPARGGRPRHPHTLPPRPAVRAGGPLDSLPMPFACSRHLPSRLARLAGLIKLHPPIHPPTHPYRP